MALGEHLHLSSDLPRNISHILKYSIRTRPCPATSTRPHYGLNSRLCMQRLDLPLVIPSDFSSTGWGERTIDPRELATAYNLPPGLERNPQFVHNLIPLQILRAVMDATLNSIGGGSTPVTQVPPKTHTNRRRLVTFIGPNLAPIGAAMTTGVMSQRSHRRQSSKVRRC